LPRKKLQKIDRILFWNIIILAVVGFIIFVSASLGLAAKDHIRYSSVILKQIILGIGLGGVACFFFSKIHFLHLRKYSFWIFIAALLLTLAVFIPGLGFSSGGATRWLNFGLFSFQPSEFLKIAFVLYTATWFTTVKSKVKETKLGLIPFGIICSVTAFVMLIQPDTDTLVVMIVSGMAMYVVAGARWTHVLLIILIGIIGLAGLIVARPYVKDRIMTFLDPAADPLASGFQIQQSLIAIGSGGITGRGFGQSVQKFSFLPEPTSDSIFAVAAEEFGMIGGLIIIFLFLGLGWRGALVASRVTNPYGGLVLIGLVTMIVVQSYMNIGAMLGVIPLSGLPLLFISHGGTALFFTLLASGIIFNISRFQKRLIKR
jgi:cell division protein FtsW